MASRILGALDWLAVRLMSFALRHGAGALELEQAVKTAYRHKTPAEAEAAARDKLHRAQLRNQVRALARGAR
jgi:hypothetical protein